MGNHHNDGLSNSNATMTRSKGQRYSRPKRGRTRNVSYARVASSASRGTNQTLFVNVTVDSCIFEACERGCDICVEADGDESTCFSLSNEYEFISAPPSE